MPQNPNGTYTPDTFKWYNPGNIINRICPLTPCSQGDPEGGIDLNVPDNSRE